MRGTARRLMLFTVTAATLLAILPDASRAATPPVHVVPAGIAGNCSRDVTGALTSWIASVPDNSVLRFGAGACYRVDGTIRVDYRHGLTLEGNGATFRPFTDGRELGPRAARTRSVFSFFHGADLTVRDTIAIGVNPKAGANDGAYVPALEAQTAYVVGGVQNMVLDHVQAYDVYGDFVYVGPRTQDLLVTGSTFAHNGRQGWTINGGHDIVFDHDTIYDTARATIDMEPTSTADVTDGVTISNNTIGHGRLFLLSDDGVAAPTSNVRIIGNRLHNRSLAVHVNAPRGFRYAYTVSGNVSDAYQSQGGGGVMSFSDVVGVVVADNVQPVQRGRGISGVALRNARNASITGNQFLNAVAPVFLRDEVSTYAQSGNWIGSPLRVAPPSSVPK